MEGSSEGPRGPKPIRFKGTPAAKSRHNFATIVILVGAGIGFLMDKSSGLKNTYNKYEQFDKRFENNFEDEMKREQFFKHGLRQIYTNEGGAVRSKKKRDETHDDETVFVASP